jgi:uncharacterized protein YuzE
VNVRVVYDDSANAAYIYLVPIAPGDVTHVIPLLESGIALDLNNHGQSTDGQGQA